MKNKCKYLLTLKHHTTYAFDLNVLTFKYINYVGIKWIHKQRDTANNDSIEWRYFTYYLCICNTIRVWCCCVKIVFYIFLQIVYFIIFLHTEQNNKISISSIEWKSYLPHVNVTSFTFIQSCVYHTITYLLGSCVQLFILPIIVVIQTCL